MWGNILKKTIWLPVVGFVFLAGCSKSIDYLIEDSEDTQETELGELQNGKQREGTIVARWEEQFEAESPGSQHTYRINVNADVIVPQPDVMALTEVSEPEFDSAYYEEMVRTLFGDTDIYYNDDAHVPRGKLDERIEEYKMNLSEFVESDEPDAWDQFYNERNQYWEDKIAVCEGAMNSAPSDYLLAEDFDVDSYMGKRNGIAYTLTFSEQWEDNGMRTKNVVMEPENLRELCPKELPEGEFLSCYGFEESEDDLGSGNQCNLTADEARRLSKRFLETIADQFDLPEMIETSVSNLYWSVWLEEERSSKVITDGYKFTYQPGAYGAAFTNFLTEYDVYKNWTYLFMDGGEGYSMDFSIIIFVTDDGVIRMQMKNPLTVETMVDHVEYLEAESAQTVIKNALEENIDQFNFTVIDSRKPLTFEQLKLGYLRLQNSKTEHTYIYTPAWRLIKASDEDLWSDYISHQGGVYINAIDGSVILPSECF